MPGFIGLHMTALVYHPMRGERVAQGMVTGRQYLPQDHAGLHNPPGR